MESSWNPNTQRYSFHKTVWTREAGRGSGDYSGGSFAPGGAAQSNFRLGSVTRSVRQSLAYADTSDYLVKLQKEWDDTDAATNLNLPEDQRIQLAWHDINYTVKAKDPATGGVMERKLLNQVNGVVRPGRLMAIMGPSGAGKTTLLHTLAQKIRAKTLTGQILYNGAPVTEELLQTTTGFVAQEDILLGTLTPMEVLRFVSKMRQPNGLTEEQRDAKILALLRSMGLERVKDSLIGFTGSAAANSGVKRGLSGGERKRVSICVELVHEPALLLLDEPTSGLDSFAAKTVIECLRRLAFTGRTIICSIHQPSAEIFRLFDDLCLMAQGQLAYFGPAHLAVNHFEGLGYPFPKFINPADYMMKILFVPPKSEIFAKPDQATDLDDPEAPMAKAGLLSNVGSAVTENQVAHLVAAFKASKLNRKLKRRSEKFSSEAQQAVSAKVEAYKQSGGHAGLLTQLALLTKREWTHATREPMILRARLGQAISSALLMGLIYLRTKATQSGISDRLSVLYFLLAGAVVAGTTAPVYIFPTERAVLMRDRSSRLYNPVMYFFSLLSVETPLNILYPVVTTAIAYWMIGFGDNVMAMLAVMLAYVLTQIASHAIGLTISAAIWNASVAVKMQPMVLAYMFLFSGYFLRESSVPVFLIWLDRLDFLKYALRSAANAIFAGQKYDCTGESYCRDPDGDSLLTRFDFNKYSIWGDYIALCGFIVGWYLIAVLLLVFKKR